MTFQMRLFDHTREECLDHLLIINQQHLKRILTDYIDYYNHARPHQGLVQNIPIASEHLRQGLIYCREVLGAFYGITIEKPLDHRIG